MTGNKRRDTKPEMAIRKAVHALGLRYRVDYRPVQSLNRRADLVFTRAKVAVFVDGCFWHGCPEHGNLPRTNSDYWASNLERNRHRDSDNTALLREAGWVVARFWEHESPVSAAAEAAHAVRNADGSGDARTTDAATRAR